MSRRRRWRRRRKPRLCPLHLRSARIPSLPTRTSTRTSTSSTGRTTSSSRSTAVPARRCSTFTAASPASRCRSISRSRATRKSTPSTGKAPRPRLWWPSSKPSPCPCSRAPRSASTGTTSISAARWRMPRSSPPWITQWTGRSKCTTTAWIPTAISSRSRPASISSPRKVRSTSTSTNTPADRTIACRRTRRRRAACVAGTNRRCPRRPLGRTLAPLTRTSTRTSTSSTGRTASSSRSTAVPARRCSTGTAASPASRCRSIS